MATGDKIENGIELTPLLVMFQNTKLCKGFVVSMYFRSSVATLSIAIDSGILFENSLFSTTRLGLEPYSHTDPSRDGKRLLAAQRADFKQDESNKEKHKVVLVQNWVSEFENKSLRFDRSRAEQGPATQ